METSPVEQFVNDLQSFLVAVVGSEMAKSGVISAYPEKYAKDIKVARKNLITFLESQGNDDLNDGQPPASRTVEIQHNPEPLAASDQPEKEPESEEVIPTDNDEKEVQLEDTDTDDRPEKGEENDQ